MNSGNWIVDFSTFSDPSDTHTEFDLEPGSYGWMYESDEDGDQTWGDDWRIPNPHLIAFPEVDAVEGIDWPAGNTVTLTINNAPDLAWEGTPEVRPWGDTFMRIEFGGDYNLKIGDEVTLTGEDGTAITYTVQNLAVIDVNQDTDTLGGTADAGAVVKVWPHGHDQEATVQSTAGGDGMWHANFTDLFDLLIGNCGRSQITDASGNATAVDWCAPKPWFAVFPEWDIYVQAFNYPFDATVHLAIDDPATEINPDFEADQITEVMPWSQNDAWAVFSLPPDYDMKPGDIVTLTSDGITPRVHTVQNLSVDMVNVKYDTITGMADTGAVVQVWPWGYEQDYTVEATAAGGRWQVDYAALGFDLVEGINGRAQISINGNVTAMDWDAHQSYDIYAFNPQTGTIQQITYLANTGEYDPSWSPNGRKVAHDVVYWNGTQGIYVTDVNTGISQPLKGAGDGGNDAAWSPNGLWIAFDRRWTGDKSIYIVPFTGGQRRLVRENAVSANWSPNGLRIAYQDLADGGKVKTVGLLGNVVIKVADYGENPAWSPDGKWIAYSRDGDIWKVRVGPLGTPIGNPVLVVDMEAWIGLPTWSDNSKTIVFDAGVSSDWDLWSVPAAGGEPTWLTGVPEYGDYGPDYWRNFVAFAGYTP